MKLTPDQQYINLCRDVIDNGTWIFNERTGKNVLTKINADLEYDCSEGVLPVLTTKKTFYKSAMAEMLGYLRGYTNAAQFRKLGTKTWDANANAEKWQASPWCAGEDDMGYCYGAVARSFRVPPDNVRRDTNPPSYDQIQKVYNDLVQGIDDRREIITFWHPGTDHMACLPACMHTHTFSVIGDTLHLTSYQRSADVPLGVPFNMIQVAWLLMTMAHITGLKPGMAYHKLVNAHIYEDQMEGVLEQIIRNPMQHPKMFISPFIKNFNDLMDPYFTLDYFTVEKYSTHGVIKFPFSV